MTLSRGSSLSGRSPTSLAFLGLALAKIGRTVDAQELLADLKNIAQKAYVSPFHYGLVHLGLEEMDQCFYWLEKAIEERDSMIFLLLISPTFDPLRSDPRYKVLLRKMNLEP